MTVARLALLSLLVIPGVGAAQKLAVTGSGKGAEAWASQVEASLCARADCAPSSSLLSKKKLDWKKVATEKVEFVVVVSAAKQGAHTVLTINVHSSKEHVVANKVLMVKSATISDKNLDAIGTTVWRTTGITPKALPTDAAEPGAQKPTDTPSDKPSDTPANKPADKPVEPPVAVADKPGDPSPSEPGTPTVTQPGEDAPAPSARPMLVIDVGASGENRSFEYAGFRSRELRAYSMPYFTSLALAVELSPFREGALSGLALEASGTVAPWLNTAISATQTVPTLSARADVGALYRLRLGSSPFTLLGRVDFHFQSFTLAQPVVGLPNATYLGLRGGLGAEVRFAERFTTFVHVNALPMFSSRDLVSAGYFQRGANIGLEVRGGLVVHLVGPLSVRASVEWTRYFIVLDTTLAQDSFAQGAVDQYLGGQLAARVSF